MRLNVPMGTLLAPQPKAREKKLGRRRTASQKKQHIIYICIILYYNTVLQHYNAVAFDMLSFVMLSFAMITSSHGDLRHDARRRGVVGRRHAVLRRCVMMWLSRRRG